MTDITNLELVKKAISVISKPKITMMLKPDEAYTVNVALEIARILLEEESHAKENA